MTDERSLKLWVSDKMHSLMGYSQAAVVQFVIGLSKKASSPVEVAGRLVEYGCPSSAETQRFAEEIYSRVPHKPTGLNTYQKEEREAALLVKKQKSYTILDADDDDDNDHRGQNDGQASPVAPQSKKDRRRFRKKSKYQDSEDEEEIAQGEEERRIRRRISSGDNNEDDLESEEARIHDQEEREQLEKNIRARDAAGTRKLMEPKLSLKEEEEAIQRRTAQEQNDTSTLRKISRQEYLKKREQKKLDELRDEILDEQYLFDGVKLTEAEIHRMSILCYRC